VTNFARGAVVSLAAAIASCGRPPLPAALDAGADAGALVWQAVAPCLDEAAYATDTRTVTFGFLSTSSTPGTPAGFSYDPKCLAIDAGDTVTFSGSFAAHPLYPSARRGTLADNPISGTSAGEQKDFVFSRAGFFAYFCGIHGGADDGGTMAGVVWAR
jgi:plastocyanin